MKNVLLISDASQQYYWQPFVEACDGRPVRLHIFDTSRFPSNAAIALEMAERGAITGWIDVEFRQRAREKAKRLSLNEIDTAWYLRAGKPVPILAMRGLEARFTQDEARFALHALFGALNCNWINRLDAIERAERSRIYQQSVATQCGLQVPQTLITNDSKEAIEFSRHHDGALLKTLGYTELGNDHSHFIYSQRFSIEELTKAATAIQACPVFCQRYIEKRYEYRVMAVGEKVLACRIDSQASPATKVDWRHYDFDNVEHIQVELPLPIEEKLLEFMKMIDLRFGAIDMIETPEGEFVFLEINPAGQWQWLYHFASLEIPDAVADMLSAF